MKAIPSIFSLAVLCLMCGAGEGHGDVPKKPVLSRYSELWTNSAFTIPPAKEVVEVEEDNPLDEYTLAGTCEVEGGWFVVLINKKERDKRIRLHPGEKNDEGFEVVKVERGASYMDTRVEIKNRSGKIGSVEYDKKFIVLKKATPRAPVGKKPVVKPGQKPPTSRAPTPSARPSSSSSASKPRVRRIPSPPKR
ncbi:MAG: hypothetical protein CMO35_00535 [Verrucomicrobiaceae bacterium]|jgi:hypothetical protein|nr:hypothetical protein [Verrucomicrobiaceae bacterium]